MRPELVFLSPLIYWEHKIGRFLALNLILKYYFYRKNFNLEKNYTKSEQISLVHTKLQSSITPRKKRKSKNLFYVEFYAGPAF